MWKERLQNTEIWGAVAWRCPSLRLPSEKVRGAEGSRVEFLPQEAHRVDWTSGERSARRQLERLGFNWRLIPSRWQPREWTKMPARTIDIQVRSGQLIFPGKRPGKIRGVREK